MLMALTKRRLPGGRGLYRDEEAFLSQGESFEGRRNELPAQNAGYASTVDPYLYNGIVGWTANTIYLHALPLYDREVTLETVRLRVTTLDVGSTIRTALYLFNNNETFTRVVGSAASHDSGTTGVKEASFTNPFRLVAGKRYFSAFQISSAVAQTAGISGGSGVLWNFTLATSAAPPPGLTFTQLTRAVGAIPGVVYLSRLWREIV